MKHIEKDRYVVEGRDGTTIMSQDESFCIYYRDIKFLEDGVIEATYLGENGRSLLDGYARRAYVKDGKWYVETVGKTKKARMALTENSVGTMVIIQND